MNSKLNDLLDKAWKARNREDYLSARKILDQAKLFCEPNDQFILGRIFQMVMQIEKDQGMYQEAIRNGNLAIDHYKKANRPSSVLHTERHLGDIYIDLNEFEKAENLLQKVLAYMPDKESLEFVNALRSYGMLLKKTNNKEKGLPIWKEIKRLYLEYNLQEGVDEASQQLKFLKSL